MIIKKSSYFTKSFSFLKPFNNAGTAWRSVCQYRDYGTYSKHYGHSNQHLTKRNGENGIIGLLPEQFKYPIGYGNTQRIIVPLFQ